MANPHVPTLKRPPHTEAKYLDALAASVALALLVAAGAVLWQSTHDEQTAVPVPDAAAPAPPVPLRGPAQAPITYYIVGSPAQADAVQDATADAGTFRTDLGEAVAADQVLLVATAEDEAVLRIIIKQVARDAEPGQPRSRFVDLRPPR